MQFCGGGRKLLASGKNAAARKVRCKMHGRAGKAALLAQVEALRLENAKLQAKPAIKARRTYNSRVTTRLAGSVSVAQAVNWGKGSVAQSGSVPEQYSIKRCTEGGEHKLVEGTTVRISDGPYKGYHIAELGTELVWCNECHSWISKFPLWYPKPSNPKPGMVYHQSTIPGNAMRSPIGNWHDPKLT